jgi:hypothetical protein
MVPVLVCEGGLKRGRTTGSRPPPPADPRANDRLSPLIRLSQLADSSLGLPDSSLPMPDSSLFGFCGFWASEVAVEPIAEVLVPDRS